MLTPGFLGVVPAGLQYVTDLLRPDLRSMWLQYWESGRSRRIETMWALLDRVIAAVARVATLDDALWTKAVDWVRANRPDLMPIAHERGVFRRDHVRATSNVNNVLAALRLGGELRPEWVANAFLGANSALRASEAVVLALGQLSRAGPAEVRAEVAARNEAGRVLSEHVAESLRRAGPAGSERWLAHFPAALEERAREMVRAATDAARSTVAAGMRILSPALLPLLGIGVLAAVFLARRAPTAAAARAVWRRFRGGER